MNEIELLERIAKGEDYHTEFKEQLPDRNELAKQIVCFANTDGGQLIIGVNDSGEIIGIEDLDEKMCIVDDVAFNRCQPPISVLQESVVSDNKTVLVINIPKGDQRPYRTKSGQYYIRSTNRCRQATREELLRLFQAGESLYFDETPVSQAIYSDLDLPFFQEFLATYLDIKTQEDELENYLHNLHCIHSQKQPTLAGLLFFGKNPQKRLPNYKIIGAFIQGEDMSIPPSDRKDIGGKIPEMIESTKSFLYLHLTERHTIEGFEPERQPEIPEVALREAIVNAIAHRDYTIDAPIRIIIYNNRVEVRTPGRLPNTVTIESMKIGGSHVLRNPTIYNLLS
ncbi:MAG: RNA-binding domain-containing protein, partial [Candidatus Helarchaeota archaeon]